MCCVRHGRFIRLSTASYPAKPWMPGPQGPGMAFLLCRREALAEPAFVLDKLRDLIKAAAGAQVAEHEWPRAAHTLGVALHHLERRADMGRDAKRMRGARPF